MYWNSPDPCVFVLTAPVQLQTVILHFKDIKVFVIMENNYYSFLIPRWEMMMHVPARFYYIYKHLPPSYICLLFAQILPA